MDLPVVAQRRAIRSDALPENIEYRDDGCSAAPRCLECPFLHCRYDVPGGIRTIRNRTRDHAIRTSREAGATPDEIAEQFDVSRRTVFRSLASRLHSPTHVR
jgi:hypothetical protein